MKLYEWNDLRQYFSECMLLGNGGSIAVDQRFSYQSLYQSACDSAALNSRIEQLFRLFNTKDFEFVLSLLSDANRVNAVLGIEEDVTGDSYHNLRSALVRTIRTVHPQHWEVEDFLDPISEFMKGFTTIISLNYDLLVYWAMLAGNRQIGGSWFKDCFIDGEFEADYEYLRTPYGAEGATLVFYPHGNLILAREAFGSEVKVSASEDDCLLNTVLSTWETGNRTPLFVSEGDTEQKLAAIKRSSYLNTVYNSVFSDLGKSIVIYGWSAGEQDDHIFSALARANPTKLAVSVYTKADDWEAYCQRIRRLLESHHLYDCESHFFDAESEGCWIHESR